MFFLKVGGDKSTYYCDDEKGDSGDDNKDWGDWGKRRLDEKDGWYQRDGTWYNSVTGETWGGNTDDDGKDGDGKDDGGKDDGKDDGEKGSVSAPPRMCYFRKLAICPLVAKLAVAGVTEIELRRVEVQASSGAEFVEKMTEDLADFNSDDIAAINLWYEDASGAVQPSWLIDEYADGVCPGVEVLLFFIFID